MHCHKLFAGIAAAALFSFSKAAAIEARGLNANQIVTNINIITEKSRNLQTPANSIDIVNGAFAIIGQGPVPQVIAGFHDIIVTVQADIVAMEGTQPFTILADEQSILGALRTFVTVHQQLLNIIIGKAGILQGVFFGPPVAAILRSLESVVDSIALGIINVIPDVATMATSESKSLDQTIQRAIDVYSS